MVDNDESGAMTADLTVNLSSRSAVDLGRSLPFMTLKSATVHRFLPVLLMAAPLDPYDERFSDLPNLPR
ncbi:hypothetical protein TNCV_3175441 [Trichonephila clavipes]|nr:hypothetical protein TNCV_3175441 [Trichonephila clavipes]